MPPRFRWWATGTTGMPPRIHSRPRRADAGPPTPPAEFPGSNSWGYNPALPMAVETTYGGPDALRALVDAAHARGIAILVDVVYNHFGRGDLTSSLWCFDGDCLGAGGIYFYTDTR